MTEKSVSRRDFLKMIIVGCGAVVTPELLTAFNVIEEGNKTASIGEQKTEKTSAEVLADPTRWKEWPVVPDQISSKIKDIYNQGISKGNDPHVFSKAGDCQNVPTYLFGLLDKPGKYNLGEYGYLEAVIKWFDGSWSYFPPTIHGGQTPAGILIENPLMKYDNNHQKECSATQFFLECEIEKRKPSIILISYEQELTTIDAYKEYLNEIVKYALERNVVPIVATCANSEKINGKVAEVAVENGIPMWNFWRAVQPLNNIFDAGLNDGFHLSYGGEGKSFDFSNSNSTAWRMRNLTGVQTIEAVLEMLNPDFKTYSEKVSRR